MITQAQAAGEAMLRAQVREVLRYLLVPVPASDRRDGEFAYLVVYPRQVPRVLRAAAHPRSGFHVQRVRYVRPGTVHLYLKAGPDGWQ